MQEKLEARIKEIQQKLDQLQERHNQLTQELQAVANEFVKTQGALEEANRQLAEETDTARRVPTEGGETATKDEE